MPLQSFLRSISPSANLPFFDRLAALYVRLHAKVLRFLAYNRGSLPRFQAASDDIGVQLRTVHYYDPAYKAADLPACIDAERRVSGLDFNEKEQLALLQACTFSDELRTLSGAQLCGMTFTYDNGMFGRGDAEMLYNIIRLKKPRRLLEIGSGQSTLVARLAIAANQRLDPAYTCEHSCVEPYEVPWLEQLPVKVIRQRVELLGLSHFEALEANDILFIDSSHVIRPFGDVLFEIKEVLPALKPGVIIQIHDIFTPRDYPPTWLRDDRRLWQEQYLLEAFLAFNSQFRIMSMLNWLHHNHPDRIAAACPMLAEKRDTEPGSFWLYRAAAG